MHAFCNLIQLCAAAAAKTAQRIRILSVSILAICCLELGRLATSRRGGCVTDYYLNSHFVWTMAGPDSSYSALEIHIDWKVESDERMEPPIQTK